MSSKKVMLLFLYACCMVAAQDDGDGGVVSLALESIRALLPSHSFLFGSKLAENYRLPANHYGHVVSKSFTYFILHSLCSNFLKNFYSIPNVHVFFIIIFYFIYVFLYLYSITV